MLSNNILTKSKLLQMIHANDLRQAFQILNTVGIGIGTDPEEYEQALIHELAETYEIVREITKGLTLFEIFRYKYDIQNIKFVLKTGKSDYIPHRSMTELGTVRKEDIIEGIKKSEIPGLPPEISNAAIEARESLVPYHDPQKADIIIDKAALKAMLRVANEFGNSFIIEYTRCRIDIENIKNITRCKHAGKDIKFLESLLYEGGYIETGSFIRFYKANTRDLAAFLRNTRYGSVLEVALDGLDDETGLPVFEKMCDNYMLSFIGKANRIVFGIEPILGYILEKENEITSIRMIMAAKMAKTPANTVIERLREHVW